MEAASLRRAPALPRRIRLGLGGGLLLLAALAWLVTHDRMGGMDMGPGTDPGTLAFWASAWLVMTSAMMFPSIAPMVLAYARVRAGGRPEERAAAVGATAIFVAGYLLAWSAAGLAAYGVLALGHERSPGFLAWDAAGPYVAGAVILAAAIYQLTPLKDACLRQCRDPRPLLRTAVRPGRGGALRTGIEHGCWCVGCCWALMAALIALGAMSVGWMIVVAALIALEKLLPWKAVANRSVAVVLVVLGLAVAHAPASVPGLTVPTGAADAHMQDGAMTAPAMDH